MREYMRKKRAKATLPPSPEEEEADNLREDPPKSPEEEEEADATADPPPSPEQDAEAIAVEVLMTLTNEASPYETKQSSEQLKAKKCSSDGGGGISGDVEKVKPGPQMIFPKMARESILKCIIWMESTIPSVNCWENQLMEIECEDDCCQGGEGCLNKRIQKCKVKKVRKERGEKDFGLFADEDIQKGEYIIKYTRKIVYKDPNNKYTMKYKDFDLWVDASKTNTLAKLMNHTCDPNCVNKMWVVKGMPRLCFFAKRDILKGQELTFSYDWTLPEADLEWKVTVCLCRAGSCNGTIEKGVKISYQFSSV